MKKITAFLLGMCGALAACTETTEGFLDSKGKEADDKAAVFADSVKTMGFHASLYWQVGRVTMSPHNVSSNLQNYKDYEAGTDNSRYSYFKVTEFTPAYTKGDFSQGGTNAGFTDFERGWQEMFQTIYRCNSFLESYKDAPMTDATKERLAYEARFIRAFFYFHLLRQYGAVPLLGDKVIDPFNPEMLPRSTFEECVDYIAGELKEVAANLPDVQDGVDYGRATRASALGVLTELYALAASPLYNGGNIGSGENRLLVGYDNYDVNRWQKVVDAAKELMEMPDYGLLVDNETEPGYGFYEATTTRVNKERIWFWVTVATGFPQKALLPKSVGGNHLIYPYHELVEAFPMKNGKAITDPDSGYDNADPYANRDPRLSHTIIYNGAYWTKTQGQPKEQIWTYKGATDDGIDTNNGSPTGYYFAKCCKNSLPGNKQDNEGQGLSFIRYPDIMLLYAEALTELDVNKNRTEIEKQLFAIRNRAGIEAGEDGRYGVPEGMTKDQMIDFIINERRIEFANECGNRFWDLKRRKLYEKLDGVWTNAAVWEKSGDYFTWSLRPIEQHFFDTRMYFSAIPQREINASHGQLIQNPGW